MHRSLSSGRAPSGFAVSKREDRYDPLGAHLAECAELEAASVHAFEQLARELTAYGAPAELIERALQSRDDEVRHAQQVGALAAARGHRPRLIELAPGEVRSLEEVALENAVEGCVRETLGAVIGLYQAERAEAKDVRAAMIDIAADELRHAALSHAVHAWITPRLDPDARARIAAAQRAAIEELVRAPAEGEPWARAAGLPPETALRAMLAMLSGELWRTAQA